MPASRPLAERFWEKVDKQGPTGPYVDTPCWLWTASVDRRGYGHIGVTASRPDRSHRVSWMLAHGEIPAGMHVLHRCHRTSCVNPDHLYLGTHAQNMRDRSTADRVNAVKGQDHPNTALTEQDARAILEARASGETLASIGKRYGITATTVADICTGQSWKHLDRKRYPAKALRTGPRRGANHPCYRITPEVKQRITAFREQGMSYSAIGKQLALSTSAVYTTYKATKKTSP